MIINFSYGRTFDPDLLRAIHPARPDREALEHQFRELVTASLMTRDPASQEFAFSHALTHEAAYNLLSFAQRESLHRAAAESLESTHAGNLKPVQARLGQHFRLARLPERAVPYLVAAGEAAADAYANRDAIDLLTSALELDEEVRGPLEEDHARARWCRLIGQALYGRDEQARAGEWFRRAIRHAGCTARSQVLTAIGMLTRTLLAPNRVATLTPSRWPEEDRARQVEGLAAGRELAVVHLWENDMARFALTTFGSAAVARRIGPSEESAYATATMGYLMSVIGFRRTGEKVGARAVAMADAVGHVQQLVSTTTAAGMLYMLTGRTLDGLAQLRRSDEAATELRSGTQRHRAKYMLADALTWLARYPESRELFLHSAELSRGAEHHVMGLANAMAALTLVREGRAEAAVNMLEAPEGVPSVLEGKVISSIIMALGILAEARLDLGDQEAALEAVREAESWITPTDDGTAYLSNVFGHGALARVRLETGTPGDPVRRGWRSETPLAAALRRLGALRRLYPAAQGRLALLQGQVAASQGRPRAARRFLRKAVAAATALHHPYEQGRSLVELAKVSPDPRRQELLEQGIQVFEAHGMALESGRASTLLRRK